MRKISNKLVVLFVTAVLALGVVGCDKWTPEQIKAVAQQTGLFAAVGWIAADNPTQDQINAVKGVVEMIEQNSDKIVAGKTYTEVVYPEVEKIIDKDFQPQYKPLAKASALSLLGALDMMFALNPEWKADEDIALGVVKAFCLGAKNGFSLDATHPAMKQARTTATLRASVQRKAVKARTDAQLKQYMRASQIKKIPAINK